MVIVMVESRVNQYPGVIPPPPGETADLVHPESIAHRLILACIICPIITLVFCLVRLYTARFIVHKVHHDDCQYYHYTFSHRELSCLQPTELVKG